MQQIGVIKRIVPLTERSYTDQNGQPAIFASLGVEVECGRSVFYIEYAQELARNLAKVVKPKQFVQVEFQNRTRNWTTQNGESRIGNDIQGLALQIFEELNF